MNKQIDVLRVEFEEWTRDRLFPSLDFAYLVDGSVEYHDWEAEQAWQAFQIGFEKGYGGSKPVEPKEATPEDREKLRAAAKNGVEIEPQNQQPLVDFWQGLKEEKTPDWTLTGVQLECGEHGFCVCWQTVSAGFGTFDFYFGKDSKVHCDNERLSKDFIKKTLCKLVDDTILDD